MVKNNFNFKVLAILLVLSLFLVNGQQSCSQGTGGTTPGQGVNPTTSAQNTGLDFAFVPGLDYLTSGKVVANGSSFFVNVLVENSAKTQRGGSLCIRDNIEDIYGGVKTECKNFLVNPAAYGADGKIISTSTTNLIFGEYQYMGIPISQEVTLTADASYWDQVTASAPVAAPEPPTEQLTVTQDSAPFTTSIEKTVFLKGGNQYQINLAIQFSKTNSEAKITTPDLKKPGLIMDPQFSQKQLNCPYADAAAKYVAFDPQKSTNFISCSVLVPKEQISYPLVVKLNYGVKIEKTFNFRSENGVKVTA